jgi:hypothetical protein
VTKKAKYALEDDSIEAILWRAERWESQTEYGVPRADRIPNSATRAAHDRHILVEEMRRTRGAR